MTSLLWIIPGMGSTNLTEKTAILRHNLGILKQQSLQLGWTYAAWVFLRDDTTVLPDDLLAEHAGALVGIQDSCLLAQFLKRHATPKRLTRLGITHVLCSGSDSVEWVTVDLAMLKSLYEHHSLDIIQPSLTVDSPQNWLTMHQSFDTLAADRNNVGRVVNSLEWLLYFMDMKRYEVWWWLLDEQNPWSWFVDWVLYGEKCMRLGILDVQLIKRRICDDDDAGDSACEKKWAAGEAYMQRRGYKTERGGTRLSYLTAPPVAASVAAAEITSRTPSEQKPSDIIYSVHLTGGLGNRLFQIASIYGLAKRDNVSFVLSSIDLTNVHSANRYETLLQRFSWKTADFCKGHVVQEQYGHAYMHETYPKQSQSALFRGYFQSEHYFADVSDDIRTLFAPEPGVVDRLVAKYPDLNNGTFVHVRRTDYMAHAMYSGVGLWPSYYDRCIAYVRTCDTSHRVFYVCSDDVDWCRREFTQRWPDTRFVFVEEDEINTLYLMSLCKRGGICANSSFSWWGAWLNSNCDKHVYFPRPWLVRQHWTWPQEDIYATRFTRADHVHVLDV